MSAKRSSGHVASRWEWIAAAVSALVVLAITAVLLREAVSTTVPPDLSVHVDSISPHRDHYLARISVRNDGTESAADLVVEGALWHGERMLERSTARLDYVPGQATRTAALLFTRDPRSHALRVRPLGFRRP